MRGCFVTGTGTGVGKTVLAGAILAALHARGLRAAAFKPALTGLDELPDPAWPGDHELLAGAGGGWQEPEEVAPWRFGPAVSPHLAAHAAGTDLGRGALLDAAHAIGAGADALVVEGVGGLLVPLAPGFLVRDLAAGLDLPLVIAAAPGLGTINHTLLTLEAARGAGLSVAGVVLTPWPGEPDAIQRSNRDTIADLGAVEVTTLPWLDRAEPATLAAAGAALPVERWLSDRDPD